MQASPKELIHSPFAAVDEPFAVALMLYGSGSTGQELKRIRRDVINYTRLLPGKDLVTVFSFGEDITLLGDFTTDRQSFFPAIGKIADRIAASHSPDFFAVIFFLKLFSCQRILSHRNQIG